MKIAAGNITQYSDIDSGLVVMNLPWSITENDEVLLEGNQSFPLETSSEEVVGFLNRRLATYREDAVRHLESESLQTALDSAAGVAGEVSGLEIND